ncbi:MAG: hypothetical protein LBQ50_01425 [Planctomycetaceae bacterium]|jgi:hypothetical protein|nr:hypothetical protein [Planctomycetaceae bacterium]
MDTQELEMTEILRQKLEPFAEECARRGYPLINLRVCESPPGDPARFAIRFRADWTEDRVSAMDIIRPILRETTPAEVHRKILSIIPELSPEVIQKHHEEALNRLQERLRMAETLQIQMRNKKS